MTLPKENPAEPVFSPFRSWWNVGRTAFLMYVGWLMLHVFTWGPLSVAFGSMSIPTWVLVLAITPLFFGLVDASWIYYYAINSGRLSAWEAVIFYLKRGYGWGQIRVYAKYLQARKQEGDELIEYAREFIASEKKADWVINLVRDMKLDEAIQAYNQAIENEVEKARRIERAFRKAEGKGFLRLIDTQTTFDIEDFPQAADSMITEIEKIIAKAKSLLKDARKLGVQDGVREHLEAGSFEGAREELERARKQKQLKQEEENFAERLRGLPPDRDTDKLEELISQFGECEKGSKRYREIKYEIEQRLDESQK